MTEINKTYTQNQPPQNQPQPLHQQLNKKGQKTWKTLKGFFGLTLVNNFKKNIGKNTIKKWQKAF